MRKFTFLCFFTNKQFFYIKAKLTVSKSLSSTWCYFLDSTNLKGCCFFRVICKKGHKVRSDLLCQKHLLFAIDSYGKQFRHGACALGLLDFQQRGDSHYLLKQVKYWQLAPPILKESATAKKTLAPIFCTFQRPCTYS